MTQPQQVIRVYDQLTTNPFYAVGLQDDVYYHIFAESTEEHYSRIGTDDDYPDTWLMRVFTDEKMAREYQAVMSEIHQYNNNELQILKFSNINDFWDIAKISEVYYGELAEQAGSKTIPVRIDCCEIQKDEWPKTIEVLWCPYSTRH